jgi:Xaa-Pro aminopeptidase
MDKLIIADGKDPNQYYATRLALDTFITLVRGKKRYVAAGGFEFPQAQAKFPHAVRFSDLGKDTKSVIQGFLKKYKVHKPLMPANTQAKHFGLVRGAKLTDELFPERAIKTKTEIKFMQAAQKANEEAFAAVLAVLEQASVHKGVAHYNGMPLTSEHLKQLAAVALAKSNHSCPDMIISSGKQTALPHHRGTGVIREGPVVVDIFPQSHETRYCADCTRTYVVGQAPKTFDERYKAVLAVQQKAIKMIKHGAKDIDATTRPLFEEMGFKTDFTKGTGYIHSLGHGIGLELHEHRFMKGALKSGNVLTIEPGLYYDYGIRIEDVGVVTKSGFKNFTKLDKNPYVS